MSNAVFSSAGTTSAGGSSRIGLARRDRGGLLAKARRHVGEVVLGDADRLGVGLGEEVPAARDAGVHPRSAHLLERDLLADHHLRHSRRAEVHRRVAVAHHDDVAEGRDVGAAGRRRPEEHADLRDATRHPDLVVEDPPGAAAAGKHLHLVGDPGAGRVDEVDHRQLQAQGPLLDADDLLDRLRAPRPGLDGRIVRHQGDPAAADRAEAGDDPVGSEALDLPVGEHRLLGEAARVEQQVDPLADRQLALLGGLLVMAIGTAGEAGRPGAPQRSLICRLAHLG